MDLAHLALSVEKGDRDSVRELVEQAVREGLDPDIILNQGLIPGMDEVGRKFQIGEYFIPHMLLAARAMQVALDLFQPMLESGSARSRTRVVMGTVLGDHHDIGKNLVGIMLKGKGFEVIDIGINVPPEKFVEAVTDEVKVVGLSALLSTTAPHMRDVIETLDKANLLNRVKTMVGGGVITSKFAEEIGADGYGANAAEAADLAKSLTALAKL